MMNETWYCDRHHTTLAVMGMSLEEYLLELFVTVPVFVEMEDIEMDWVRVTITGRVEDWEFIELCMQRFEREGESIW